MVRKQNPKGQESGEGTEPEQGRFSGLIKRLGGLRNIRNVDYMRPFRWVSAQASSAGKVISDSYHSNKNIQNGVKYGLPAFVVLAAVGSGVFYRRAIVDFASRVDRNYRTFVSGGVDFAYRRIASLKDEPVVSPTRARPTAVPATLEEITTPRASPTQGIQGIEKIALTPTLEPTPTQAPTPAYTATLRATLPATAATYRAVSPAATRIATVAPSDESRWPSYQAGSFVAPQIAANVDYLAGILVNSRTAREKGWSQEKIATYLRMLSDTPGYGGHSTLYNIVANPSEGVIGISQWRRGCSDTVCRPSRETVTSNTFGGLTQRQIDDFMSALSATRR